MAKPLASLENDATQFIAAMRHANYRIFLLRPKAHNTITPRATPANDGPNGDASMSVTHASTAEAPAISIPTTDRNPTAIPQTTTHATPTPTSPHHPRQTSTQVHTGPADSHPADPNAESRAAFEAMRQQWLLWGESVMRSLQTWLDRPDLGIADRVRAIGMVDRMAWYGVRGASGA